MLNHLLATTILVFIACSNTTEQTPAPTATEPIKTESPVAAEPMIETENQAAAPVSATAVTVKKAGKKPAPAPIPAENRTPVEVPVPPVPSPAPAAAPAVRTDSKGPISHDGFDALLEKYVSTSGQVNYKGLKADKEGLYAYCELLAQNPVQDEWSRADKMAYWINAYNAFTLKLIVDNYPTKSILNFDKGKTWDVRRIKIDGKRYSLNNIENDILRPEFQDARIHFAINCAAKSCPPIWNHAYTADNLDSALESRTKAFINDAQYNTITASRAQVSKIFDWYAADFGKLQDFLNKYLETPVNSNAAIRYNEYNWDLNE